MVNGTTRDVLRWYVIHTNPRQEERADNNLRAWGVETFSPRLRERRSNQYSGESTYVIKPFFPGYMFARISSTQFLKVHFTRGVRSVVRFGDIPAPVDDEIITAIRSEVGEDGYIKLDGQLKPGDKVIIEDGPMQSFRGVFVRDSAAGDRVMVLLEMVNYQAHLEIEKQRLRKLVS